MYSFAEFALYCTLSSTHATYIIDHVAYRVKYFGDRVACMTMCSAGITAATLFRESLVLSLQVSLRMRWE
jgi:hypothetical protein